MNRYEKKDNVIDKHTENDKNNKMTARGLRPHGFP